VWFREIHIIKKPDKRAALMTEGQKRVTKAQSEDRPLTGFFNFSIVPPKQQGKVK
jgi:hypothetical protein